MAKTLIRIGDRVVEASAVTMPATGRRFRSAWTFSGDIIEVDLAAARDIRIRQLIAEANEQAAEARENAAFSAAKGDAAMANREDARSNRLRQRPAAAAVAAINSAKTPSELSALTLDDFLP